MSAGELRQTQKAGDQSLQIQADGNVYLGVTEERAHEIARMTSQEAIDRYAAEGHTLIQDRIFKLDDRVIGALVRSGRIGVFADPGFQKTYRAAQAGAASTERDEDYELLSALVVDRVLRGEDRKIRAGIARSIEIVDQVDADSLRGLTVFHLASRFRMMRANSMEDALDHLSLALGVVLDGPLPLGLDWIEHLDILDAIRAGSGPLRPFADFFPEHALAGYLSVGVSENEAPRLISGLDPVRGWGDMVVPHELKPGFVRLRAIQVDVLEETAEQNGIDQRALKEAAESDYKFSTVDPECRTAVAALVDQRENLRRIGEWWDQIPLLPDVTAAGRVLARANTERLDEGGLLPRFE